MFKSIGNLTQITIINETRYLSQRFLVVIPKNAF
jgi:hypothetical protein